MNNKLYPASALLGAALLVGCGGDVTLPRYNSAFVPLTAVVRAVDIFSDGAQTHTLVTSGGAPFYQAGTGSGFLPNAQTATTDLALEVGPGGVMVGYDPDAAPGSGGLMGTVTTWGEETLGLTLGTDRLRLYAIGAGGAVAGLRVPGTGAATVVRRVGTTVTSFTNFTNFRPVEVSDVNGAGKVVGSGLVGTAPESRAFMSDGTTALVDLGGGTARSVNSAGIVVGMTEANLPYRTRSGSSLLRNTLPILPGFSVGEATGISESGVIVGWVAESMTSARTAVVWYTNGAVVALSDRTDVPSFAEFRSVLGVAANDSMVVQANNRDAMSESTVFVVTPISN